ncbi:MAG: MarR family transcriptional regulator, partial [Pseudoclavibacter sp.]
MERRKWAAEMTAGSSSVTRAFAHTTARSTNDLVRRQNLATVLTMLHLDGTLSRGEIGEATGLTRSTIAGLASELVELGLAVETESAPTGRVG